MPGVVLLEHLYTMKLEKSTLRAQSPDAQAYIHIGLTPAVQGGCLSFWF